MLNKILAMPFLVILIGMSAVSMILPAAHALVSGDFDTMRVFFYSGLLLLILVTLIALATHGRPVRRQARSHLIALLATYTVLPALLAFPFYEAVGNTSFLNAYFEMVSSLTTTGATLFDQPDRLAPSVHLWRALVGWLGGFFSWVTAIAILAPLNLGGFEVLSTSQIGQASAGASQIYKVADSSERLTRYSAQLFPVYSGLTVLLWVLLQVAGQDTFLAFNLALSTMSTSGILPVSGLENSGTGMVGEAIVVLFLLFALSRQTFARLQKNEGIGRLKRDPEFTLGVILVLGVPLLLFLRHWFAAFEVDDPQNLAGALDALWGGIFMVLSFLTTTGFESGSWDSVRAWSGLATPGLLLVGLSLLGGGVATTAGGVKLLRVYALYRHGERELEKLVHPNSIGGAGASARHMRRQGAFVAWIFFMLFAISIAAVMALLALVGVDFEQATVLAVAALSTTGPLVQVVGDASASWSGLSDAGKMIAAGAMVLGRMETLAIIALLNPAFWRV
jgi:trk/ktr system potassium uptake protein